MSTSTAVTRGVLEATPGRVLVFLRAAGTEPTIKAALALAGYTQDEHEVGWSLLLRVSGYGTPKPITPAGPNHAKIRDAMVEVDNTDEAFCRRVGAALQRKHPEQHAFVFDGVAPSTGAGAVLTVAKVLDRLDALENSPERVATREADHAALATLAKRGYGPDERARLRGLVVLASSYTPAEGPAPEPASNEQKLADLEALRAWFVDWSETARGVISRRDHLIRLGLAKRKKAAKADASTESPVVLG